MGRLPADGRGAKSSPSNRARTVGPRRGTGLLVLHIDGLGAATLAEARRLGLAPNLDALLTGGDNAAVEWSSALPSDTLAVQSGLFWGSSTGIPAYQWWDRDRQRRVTAMDPATVVALDHAHASAGVAGLLSGGACHSAAIGGGAARATLTVPSGGRTMASTLRDTVTAAFDAIRRRQRPLPSAAPARANPERLGAQASRRLQAVAAGGRLAGAVAAAGAIRDLREGLPVVFASFIAYDLVAHLGGPRSAVALGTITPIDRSIALVLEAITTAPREYVAIILSDHGVCAASPARDALAPDPVKWVADEWARRGRPNAPSAVEVVASGTLLNAWVRGARSRLDIQELDRCAPGFVSAVSRHPMVGLAIVADRRDPSSTHPAAPSTVLAFGPGGVARLRGGDHATSSESWHPVISIEGRDPLATFDRPREVAAHVARYGARNDAGDVTCIAAPLATRGTLPPDAWSFEGQAGAHGGIGGEQGRPFVIAPRDCLPGTSARRNPASMHSWLRTLLPSDAGPRRLPGSPVP